ncbi:MDR family MFS transporter [Rarobacter faecitabidus]|uniref:EmrB/QacA subfamily drug resistance transporter n=1 Tax=Rarobacter faecitabidus TaxID=13243 RepID=A0A542ZDT3_RARFA|nr:DHA2 family efflux MFS transporter permease subunit [Rarobacter faecitabidus]TQL58514.1 EmrB/QacA subfamily drug resistance transporter [Rarobacter faecitabidus]
MTSVQLTTNDSPVTPIVDAPIRPRREVLEALSGILVGLFVSVLSTTIISSSLPVIVSDLGGSQASFTWIVTATLLTSTISTPIWGKLADLVDRKRLIQIALIISVVSSAFAGMANGVGIHIAFRALQGIGAGGLMALGPVLIADIISPRERGKYMGYVGAVTGVAMVGGPVLGGFITEHFGWRWIFYLTLPFAIVAIITIQRTLRLPVSPRKRVRIDYVGAALISLGVATLLLWVTFAGSDFAWASWQSGVMVGGALIALIAAVMVELRSPEPLLPMHLFKNRTFVIAVIASAAIGVSLFGSSVFLSQYMQLARGYSTMIAGLASLPTVVGMFLASTISGNLISASGRYKRIMIAGSTILVLALASFGLVDEKTPLAAIFASLFFVGIGVGMLMQNLVLVTQNSIEISEIGAGSSAVAFFRTMGGAMGVAALGSVLAVRVKDELIAGLSAIGIPAGSMSGSSMPSLSELDPKLVPIVEHAYGVSVPEMFLIGAPVALIALIALFFLREVPLGRRSGIELREEQAAGQTVEA